MGVPVSKKLFDAGQKRAFTKSVTYRLFGTGLATLAAWFLSHDLRVSLGVCTIDAVGKIVLYYIHERIWNRIPWGRRVTVLPDAE